MKKKLGIGSGSTVVYVVERLAERISKENLQNIVCVATSFQSNILLQEKGIETRSLNEVPELDLTIDGADEVDQHLQLIKGGGACQLQEKLVAANSKKLVIVADYRKQSQTLGQNVNLYIFFYLFFFLHFLSSFFYFFLLTKKKKKVEKRSSFGSHSNGICFSHEKIRTNGRNSKT